MKKTLAILLSLVLMLGVLPIAGSAAEVTLDPAASSYAAYERYKVSANDAEYIDSLSYDQIASLILDWVDRQIAAVTADFENFEVEVMGQTFAVAIPEIKGIDDIVAYADYLTQLEGDFKNLNTANLVSLSRENGDVNFIYGMLQFMADNADIFGKVFHWEEGKVFDYGKVGEYILALDTTDENNKKIVDFYNDYLIGNDIQEKFIAEIAKEMVYTVEKDENGERTETFDEIISNGILAWFAGLCETNGILSADGIAALKAYDLRTTDIYTLVENFVGLVQSDNQVKIDTYYNYLLDTAVRTMLKTMLGYTPVVGEAVADDAVVAAFNTVYADLALLEEISGGSVYFKNGDAYYEITLADAAVSTVKALTWEQGLDINFEAPTVGIYTGENAGTLVKEYKPTSPEYKQLIYSTYADQIAAEGFEVAGTTVADEYTALMVDANKGPAMSNCFGIKVAQGEEEISSVVIGFDEIESFVNTIALKKANELAAGMIGETITAAEVTSVDVTMGYEAWATDDEFIVQVNATAKAKAKVTVKGFTVEQELDASSFISNPVAVIVLDDLSGNLNIDGAKELFDFIDTDFAIDADLLDIAGNYDAFDGAVGQVNHILYGLVDMLVSDAGMEKLNLTDGDNTNLTDNLQKICDTANDMMAAAEDVMNDEGLQELIGSVGIDLSAILADLPLDLLYAINFESVEDLYVSAINLALDVIDNGENALIADIHTAVDGLTNLDAMAVAVTDYALAKCIPAVNEALAGFDVVLSVPAATDAKTVADGEGKDIIMTKLVDVAYEAVTKATDDVLNSIVNDFIAKINGEASTDLPSIAFAFGVEKGDNWQATLTAMVDRVYELANGIIIACGTYEGTDTFDRISAVANAMLPLGSLASNCASDEFAFDIDTVLNTYMFAEGLEGDLDNFLGLFETKVKTDDVAAGVPVTKALINASEHIVDAIFPDTVNAENYAASTTVKEEFTSGDNDVVIAANNMRSINGRKTHLVPAALNLVREAGILPYFAACEHKGETKTVEGTAATCTESGKEAAVVCADCGYVISGGEVIGALGHKWNAWTETKAPTCTEKGVETRTCANGCGETETREVAAKGHSYGAWTTTVEPDCVNEGQQKRTCACGASETKAIAATGHADADGNKVCDVCGFDWNEPEEPNFFEKIIAFFKSIIEWFKNLFS
ncbi:MAG: hypothetical protein IJC45_10605 [Clostridia bacterium]|nr:hypothetical protein [Clostridia bacterium]